ncbi:hypothetical protein [uncultured Sphingomonas sp.]|uniref:hypothetical protein n=1 Tax=uncultured Sphingomonas sp. TaxID=158754 RepID=UPI0035CAB7E7
MRRLLPFAVPVGIVALVVIVASCVPTPPPAPRAGPAPAVVSRPVPTPMPLGSDWRDWPITPGDWAYRSDGRGSIALFGTVGEDARVTLRCDAAARSLYLSVAGARATTVTVRTTSLTRALPVQPVGGGLPYVAAALPVNDPLFDAMAFSRGRFVLDRPGAPPLVVPAWAEVDRVIEDCRG